MTPSTLDLCAQGREALARWRWVFGAALLASAVACGGGDGATTPMPVQERPVTKLDSIAMSESAEADPRLAQIREVILTKSAARVAPIVHLDPLVLPKQAEEGGALRIGAGRDVALTAKAQDMAGLWHWTTNEAGRRVAVASFESAAAQGLRLGLQVTQLPPRSLLRVSGSGGGPAVEIESAEVLRSIQRNLDAGTPDEEARLYWLPLVEGAQATLEIELAPDAEPAWLEVAVPQLSHLWVLPEQANESLKNGASASCNVDVTCTRGHEDESHAVARMVYVKGGSTYLCSGALMNNTRSDYTPYFLSADHCISTQAVASTLQTDWFYRSASCNSSAVNPGTQRLRGGATLLYANASTDTAFMRLNDQAPDGVMFAGWDARTPSGSGPAKGLHHPRGDLQKVSIGTIRGFGVCEPTENGQALCKGPLSPQEGTHVIVTWNSGVVEGGSSGSPLFATEGGKSYVMAQLHAGSSSCSTPQNPDLYGRFDLAFNAALKTWLAPSDTPAPSPGARSPVFRFYNATTGAHFYTNSVAERDFVISRLPEFAYEGPRFQAANQAGAGLHPVYRFYNGTTGAHFYTISAAERDFVVARLPEFKYEGPTWFAQTQSGNGASGMHRFYNTTTGTHFYTIIPGEVYFVRERLPEFKYEGVAYYAWR